MNRAGELARSVSARSDGLLNGILVHRYKVSAGQWNLHVITEWVKPRFVVEVGDENGDAERIGTGSSSNRSLVNGRSVLPWLAGRLPNLRRSRCGTGSRNKWTGATLSQPCQPALRRPSTMCSWSSGRYQTGRLRTYPLE